jgi:hypothetical protein
MRRVILESPYNAATFFGRWLNRRYARRAMRDSIMRGESPMVSHLLFTQALDDGDPSERKIGIECGLVWGAVANATVIYIDRGISSGMALGIERARCEGRATEYRTFGSSASSPLWSRRTSSRSIPAPLPVS